MAKVLVKLFSSSKSVGATVRVIFGRVTFVIMAKLENTQFLDSLLAGLLISVRDEAGEWSPPGSERSHGTRLAEREREEHGKGSFVFLQCASTLAP